MSTTTADRIRKESTLATPRPRVWRALADAREFGSWFQAAFEGPFRAGERVRGRITHPGYEAVRFELVVEAMEPERRFAFTWQPDGTGNAVEGAAGPSTRVEFTLEDAGAGTRLVITETGFERIPAGRRAEAIRRNESGWEQQMAAIETYLRRHP